MRRLVVSLAVGLGGMALLLVGLSWDALLHAADPGLAGREGLFTASNPGHVLLALGIAVTLVGLLSAGDAALAVQAGGSWGRGGLRRVAAGVSVLVVGATAFTGVWAARAGHDGGHETAAHDNGHGHEPAAVPVAVTPPAPAAHADGHGHGAAGNASGATPEQRATADRLLAETKAGAKRWASQANARADGFRPITPVWNGIQHWHNQRFHTDGKVLDPAAPEELIYASTSRGPVLVAAMYVMPEVGQPGPKVGGPLTVWHAHDDLCFTPDAMVVGFARPNCPAGSVNLPTPEMLHVWVVDNPDGPFAPEMSPTALVAVAEG
ncbi:MAG TPA: hypothetical protein VM938_06230 [Acidimicrobiales bacterium]|nr:hypothetical protein [Acidimicrobiales bacterium]